MSYTLVPFDTVLQAISASLIPVRLKVFHQDKWSDSIILSDKPIREVVALLAGLGHEELILCFGGTTLRTHKANANYFKFETDKLNSFHQR